jgi:site-specific recombinase XerD
MGWAVDMRLMALRDASGNPIGYDALAGKIQGKQVRKRFTSRRYESLKRAELAAKAWLAGPGAVRVANLRDGTLLSEGTKQDAVKAIRLLEPTGVPLLEAVRCFVAQRPELTVEPWTFGQAVDAFLEAKRLQNARRDYLRTLSATLGQARRWFGAMELDAITEEALVEWIKDRETPLAPVTMRNYRRDLAMLWRFAIQRRHATRNPAAQLPKPMDEDRPVEILNPDQAARLLAAARPRIVPYLALGLFAGLRPFEALAGGAWGDTVTVRAATSKSRKNRHVTVPDNLKAWLERAGRWPALTHRTVRDLVGEAKESGGVQYGQDVLRHSFASHHLALHRNASLTAHEMGHRSQQMLYARYHRLVTHEQALQYFSIRPTDPPRNERPTA